MIRFLRNKEIDRQKWDATLACSNQSTLFAQSWYLDVVSPNWCALVRGDYEEIFPLPVKNKLGFKYLVQPNFTQQLGLFSCKKKPLPADEWINFIKKKYRRFDFCLNTQNTIKLPEAEPLSNCELPLQDSYETLKSNYATRVKRNLKKSYKADLQQITLEEFIKLKLQNRNGLPSKMYDIIPKLYAAFLKNGVQILLVGLRKDELLAGNLFVIFENRLIGLSGVSSPVGRKHLATFTIIDHLIKKYSSSDMVLDFKGGKMEGTKLFFLGFGAVEKTYFRVSRKF